MDEVVICEYDPAWPEQFLQEKAKLAAALGPVREIEHIGSTAVPGLGAKPVIDIQVAVDEHLPLEEYKKRLEPLGYVNMPQDNPLHVFFRKGMPRTHHLHIFPYDSWDRERHLLFRDYLRAHPEAAQAYEALKRRSAEEFRHDRPEYVNSKTALIEKIVASHSSANEINPARKRGRVT